MFQKIIEFSIQNRLIVILSIVILIAIGVNTLQNLTTEFLPDLSSPIVSVITEKPWAPRRDHDYQRRPSGTQSGPEKCL